MNNGIKILLERVKTHPDEFKQGSKWDRVVTQFKDILPEADYEAYRKQVSKIQEQQFTDAILTHLLADERQQELFSEENTQQYVKYRVAERYAALLQHQKDLSK